jgi:hypothetical protein
MDAYTKAKAELSEIDSKIAALQKRRAVLRQFIELGDSLYSNEQESRAAYLMTSGRLVASMVAVSRETSAKARILSACKAYLLHKGSCHTRELAAALAVQGIELSGSDKLNTLSVLLSKSDEFRSDRKIGWSLTTPHKEVTPQGAGTPAGSDVGSSTPALDWGPDLRRD